MKWNPLLLIFKIKDFDKMLQRFLVLIFYALINFSDSNLKVLKFFSIEFSIAVYCSCYFEIFLLVT